MSRTGEEGRLKKSNCCLTCSIVCFVIFIVFILVLYIGGTIMFKSYVSPHIGGLGLNDALALAGNVLSGKEAKPTYTEEDLDSFYSGLSDAMFLSDKTEDELEYELLSDETKAAIVPASTGDEDADADADYDAFRALPKANRYALLSDEVKALLSLEEYSALAATTDTAVAARKKVGLKTYRLSLQSIMSGMDFGAEDFSMEKGLQKSLSSLEFNFDSLENYDINDAAAEQNEKFTTFSVNGNQASAFINDVITYFLTMEDSPVTSALKDTVVAELDLASFVTVASVTIMNTPLAVVDGEAAYDQKDTALGVVISIRLRDLVKAALETSELKEQLSSVPAFAMNLIPKLVPQFFSASLTVYPLAQEEDGREIVVTVNKPSEKNSKRLATLVNALLGEEKEDATKTFFGEINDKVVETFSSVNKTVKINFVPSKDKDGKTLKDGAGNTYAEMKIMTWETVLALLDDQGRLSAHDVFTMLKCLYISGGEHSELNTDTAMSEFKSDMAAKYGVTAEFLESLNVFSTDGDGLSDIVNNVDFSTLELKDNDDMKVHLPAKALAAFMKDFITGADSGSVAAAEEESSSSILDGLDLKITDVLIKKVSESEGVAVYSLELGLLVNVQQMLSDKLPSDGIAGTLSSKLLPKGDSFFGIKLYLSEYTESDKLMHKVGKNIDNPAEGQKSKYLSEIRINDFTYAETSRVFDALNTFMQVLSDTSFEISTITGDLEDAINDVFSSLATGDFSLDLSLYEEENGAGGLNLPSLYELLVSVVKPKLDEEESFDTADAKLVLEQVFQANPDVTKTFTDGDASAFTDDINDKYYIKHTAKLTIDDLFGKDEEGNSNASKLSSKISATSIYFKDSDAEVALWKAERGEEYKKESIYGDDRNVEELCVTLSGKTLAALVEKSGMVPTDVAAAFGEIKVVGASFRKETVEAVNKIYLTFTLALERKEDIDMTFGNALPKTIKLSADILLYQDAEYTEAEPRFSTKVIINDKDSAKTFLLLKAIGGEELSEDKIGEKISDALSKTFEALEDTIPLTYSEEGIRIADVFTFLVKETEMKDSTSATSFTAAQDLADRLRAFGLQTVEDKDTALTYEDKKIVADGDYSWVTGLKLFNDTDDDYIYVNMQKAYFLNETPDIDLISNSFASTLGTITTDNFNLKGENGLFHYDGDILQLKINDLALGKIVESQQDLSGAVGGSSSNGLSIAIKSLKLSFDEDKLVIDCGVLISFDDSGSTEENPLDYSMMPKYFFIKTHTVQDASDPSGFKTTLTLNNMETDDTAKLFENILSLAGKGVNFNSLNKENIESTINNSLSDALKKFPESVKFEKFSEEDITKQYNTANYGENIRVNQGDVCITFPSVYYYLRDILYNNNENLKDLEEKPDEKQLQSMIVALQDPNVASKIVTNEKSASAYHVDVVVREKSSNYLDIPSNIVLIYSDKYLGYTISSYLAEHAQTINDDITLDGIDQTIILHALSDETENSDNAARKAWRSKFFKENENFVYNHDYLIVTATVSLAGYSSGNAEKMTSILPSNLCLTVLIDLDNSAGSKGLLYAMSQEDMHFFEQIMGANNAKFNINDIAVQLAGIIKTTLDTVSVIDTPYGTFNFVPNYRLDTEDFNYYTYTVDMMSFPPSVSYSTAHHVADEWNYKEEEEALDDGFEDGVGYVILARTNLSE